MAKKKIILDCRVGDNVAGDTVLLDEKLADELVGLGRAVLAEAEAKAKANSKAKA